MGALLLSRAWLFTVEALGPPGHPSSTHLDAVVNNIRLTPGYYGWLLRVQIKRIKKD